MDFKKIIVWIIAIILIAQIGYYFYSKNNIGLEKENVTIGQQIYSLWVADNQDERSRGLQNITKMKDKQGMLFKFDDLQEVSFWNKDTYIDLVILWVKDYTVIGVDNLSGQIDNNIVSVSSPDKVDTVIELKQNQIEQNNLKVGDKINILK